jgi:hypothetical protein
VSINAVLLFVAVLLSLYLELIVKRGIGSTGEKTEDLVAFLDRLYIAKRQVISQYD